MGFANESCRYNVILSLIGWAYTRNDPCLYNGNSNTWEDCLRFVTISLNSNSSFSIPGSRPVSSRLLTWIQSLERHQIPVTMAPRRRCTSFVWYWHQAADETHTASGKKGWEVRKRIHPKNYAHSFVLLCFVVKISFDKTGLKIVVLKSHRDLPGTNELNLLSHYFRVQCSPRLNTMINQSSLRTLISATWLLKSLPM